MAALTTQNIVAAGTKPTYGTPGASDTFEVGDGTNTFIHVINKNAASRTITIDMSHVTLETGDVHPDKVYTLGDGSTTPTEAWIPCRKSMADAAQNGVGRGKVTVSASTDVTIAVVRMG
jgi:hypothetical protein